MPMCTIIYNMHKAITIKQIFKNTTINMQKTMLTSRSRSSTEK